MPDARYKGWLMSEPDSPILKDSFGRYGDKKSLELLMQSILASVPDAMIVINDTGQILAFSAEAERLFGYTAEDVAGKNVSVLMAGADEKHHDQYISNYLATGEKQIIGIGRIVRAKLANGDSIPVELKIGEAEIDGHRLFTGYIRDMSEQQANAHRLAQMQVELANFSRLSAVGTMASAMAHELNQPLTAVANYLEAARDLLDSADPETLAFIQEALDAAATQSIRAGQIVRRLRDYVSRGELDLRSVQIQDVVDDAISLAKVGIEGQLARVISRIPEDFPPLLADRLQLRQVIVNLVRNAIEALADTANPQVWIQAELQDDLAVITVEDNGPGYQGADDASPFDAFNSSKVGGMGLGLSICQTILDAHGTDIEYAPSPRGGAAFKFTLRLAQGEE
ncbi:MAG: PAS domain S-box protein [Pseudomonadota bacterium]|nr:PAS domain S-box protein [Pseudomonadota bacterium]